MEMMEVFEGLEYIKYISSAFTFIFAVVAVGAWQMKVQAEEKRRLIDSANDSIKGELVDKALDLIRVDTKNLTREQKYNLAMELIKRRAERFKIFAVLASIVCLVTLVVSSKFFTHSPQNGYPLPLGSSSSPFKSFESDFDRIQIDAEGMSYGPLRRVQKVSSNALKLANDILEVNVTKTQHKIDRHKYAAIAFLFASDAAQNDTIRIKYAGKVINQVSKAMELVSTAKARGGDLSRELSSLDYVNVLRHLYLGAVVTFIVSGRKEYEDKYKSLLNELDQEYFRNHIGDNFKSQRIKRLNEIKKLWELE